MYNIRPEYCFSYASFLRDIRSFFIGQGFLEVETPLLGRTGSVEAHLDSFQVSRGGVRKSPHAPAPTKGKNDWAGYLITSPEYRLKALLPHLDCNIYQIAHCFRAGDIGKLHLEEFLMVEWYLLGADEFALMDQCEQLLKFLVQRDYSCVFDFGEQQQRPLRRSVSAVMQEYAGCDCTRQQLETCLAKFKAFTVDSPEQLNYSDLFFTVFLNLVEPHLGKSGPEFIYHYPKQLSALSQVDGDYARRFELYWHGVELANAYYELISKQDYLKRFAEENQLRKDLGKKQMDLDQDLLSSLEIGLPECSGIALGLDRLFLLLIGQEQKGLGEIYERGSNDDT